VFGEARLDPELTRDEFTPMPRVDGWESPIVKNRRKRTDRSPVNPFLPRRLRAEIEIAWPSPPPSVVEAQRAAHEAIARLENAASAVHNVAGDRDLEQARHEAAVAAAYREQTKAPRPPRTDWSAEAVTRKLHYSTAVELAVEAVRAFGRARDAAVETWLADLTADLPALLEEAQVTLRGAAKAVRRHRSTVDAVRKMSIDTGRFGANWHQSASGLNPTKALAGLADAVAVVESDDPVLTGLAYVTEDDMSPPSHTRAAMQRRADKRHGGEDFVMLAQISDADKLGEVAPCAKGNRLSSPGVTAAEGIV